LRDKARDPFSGSPSSQHEAGDAAGEIEACEDAAYRELDDALGLSDLAGERLADARTGKNGRHALVGMLRQAVFGRLVGYQDVNDAERLRHDPAMRWIVGGKAAAGCAASASQMGRLETQWLASGRKPGGSNTPVTSTA
jgi:Transposase DDE domain group 1